MTLLAAHERFLASAVERLADDDRVAAVLLTGSAGRGEADEWSDVDVNVIAFDDASPEVLSHPHAAEAFGDLAVWVDCSFNAPPDGSMSVARYLSDDGLLLVDWHVWPLQLARLTDGARVLWLRPTVALEPYDGTVVDLVMAGTRRVPPPYSRQQRAEWELCMVHIAASRPARGVDGRGMLGLIGITDDVGPDAHAQLDALDRHVSVLEPWIAPRAWSATRERIEAARRVAR